MRRKLPSENVRCQEIVRYKIFNEKTFRDRGYRIMWDNSI